MSLGICRRQRKLKHKFRLLIYLFKLAKITFSGKNGDCTDFIKFYEYKLLVNDTVASNQVEYYLPDHKKGNIFDTWLYFLGR